MSWAFPEDFEQRNREGLKRLRREKERREERNRRWGFRLRMTAWAAMILAAVTVLIVMEVAR